MEFNRGNCQILVSKIIELIKPLEKEFGVKIKSKSATYTEDSLNFKFEILKVGDSGSIIKSEDTFKVYAKMYGLDPEDLGKTFQYKNQMYKITGINPRSKKYPIEVINIANKKGYKFPVPYVKVALGKQFTKKQSTYEEFIINSSDVGNVKDIL
jgi:hypothetical protein